MTTIIDQVFKYINVLIFYNSYYIEFNVYNSDFIHSPYTKIDNPFTIVCHVNTFRVLIPFQIR